MIEYKNPKLLINKSNFQAGEICWRSPSNIAIIKYWGKHELQLPRNPSFSFTLNNAHTFTCLAYNLKETKGISFELIFEGKENTSFHPKIFKFFEQVVEIYPFIEQLHFRIETENTFPHSAGIASSASAMSALSLCLCTLERKLFNTLLNQKEFLQKASYLSRIGSGSACRSVYPTAALWGETNSISESSNLFAIPFKDEIHKVFHTYHDDILIVSKIEKSVPSSAGHDLMEGNIYAMNRYQQAKDRLNALLKALKEGDLVSFGTICEAEALTLHALMMTSNPSYLLLKPSTLSIIEEIRNFRTETSIPVYFTLDAGPNVHLLYPDEFKEIISEFITQKLLFYCIDQKYIQDIIGEGPSLASDS
ncbi:MAG TPA: hypothetical protein VK590_09400 [Saprospiraceae bacterium]|nr:hypothetical protein [Saprospiraceae bacterium]